MNIHRILVILIACCQSCAHFKERSQPIAAIFWENKGISPRTNGTFLPKLIMAVKLNGNVIWSKNKYGGEPYCSARLAPDQILQMLANLERASVLEPKQFENSWCDPDSSLISIVVNYKNKITRLESWHELYEDNINLVVVNGNVIALEKNETKASVMKKASKEFISFLHRWDLIRQSLTALIPPTGEVYTGSLPAPINEQNRN